MLEAHAALLRLYEQELRRDCGIPLAWYEVLVSLAESTEAVRMSDLAERLLLSRSWLTRRIDAMEAAGLVVRSRADDDGRGVCASLTAAGRELHRRAVRSHSRSVEEHFLAHVGPAEAAVIQACFVRVGTGARSSLRRRPPRVSGSS